MSHFYIHHNLLCQLIEYELGMAQKGYWQEDGNLVGINVKLVGYTNGGNGVYQHTLCIDHIHVLVTHCASFLVIPLYLLYSGFILIIYIYTLTHTSQIQAWKFASEHSTAY